MKYYSDIISNDIAEKLKAAGIHPLRDARMEGCINSEDNITYGEVFDWLMSEKDIYVWFEPQFWESGNRYLWYVNYDSDKRYFAYWHDAADAAIEKSLQLIKDEEECQTKKEKFHDCEIGI